MVNIEALGKIYDKYKEHKKELSNYKKMIKQYDIDEEDIEHNFMMSYHYGEIYHLLNSYFYKTSQFVTMVKDNDLYLMDLKVYDKKRTEMVSLGNQDSDFVAFIIKMLKAQNIYIGNINANELPLLMAIKEDVDKIPDLSHLSKEDRQAEKFFIEIGIPERIQNEYARTLKQDSKTTSIPFVTKSDAIIKAWDKLDEERENMTEEEYWIEYYKLLILFGNNIEQLYMEADEDKKNYVLDAYYYYSSEVEPTKRIRTASPIINEEILKRKIMKK